MIAPYIYESSEKKFTKNKTGFGLMVAKIAKSIAVSGHTVYVLTNALTSHDILVENVCLVKHSFIDIVAATSIPCLLKACLNLFKTRGKIHSKIRRAYLEININFLKKRILMLSPDIVHIHGLGYMTSRYINLCKEIGIPFLITAHGLLEKDMNADEIEKQYEKQIFQHSVSDSYVVTVVSSGMKRKLQGTYYKQKNVTNIIVINNATDTTKMHVCMDNICKDKIFFERRVCIAVGSVYCTKNQMQLVRAISLLPHNLRQDLQFLIIGSIKEDYPIKEYIESYALTDCIHCIGFVNHANLAAYYGAAELNILTSNSSEGFGISMIEGFVYGVPCVTFADLDAVPDIYDEHAMCLCRDRTDQALADAIVSALDKQWDRSWIMKYSKNFSLETMANRYLDVYTQVISNMPDERNN